MPLSKLAASFFDRVGRFALIIGTALRDISVGKISIRHTIEQAASIGYDSVPMSLTISSIAGSVLALQMAQMFAQSGAERYVGGLVSLAIVREIAPMFTALSVGARAGTAIAAEIANMKVSQQIDALEILHVSPIRYLIVPRLLACVLGLPLLTVLGEVFAIVSGMLIAQHTVHLNYHQYLDSVWLNVKPYDIEVSLLKAMIFGIILAGVSGLAGFLTTGGAKDVGKATTHAAVWTAITVIIADFFLTWIFFGTTND